MPSRRTLLVSAAAGLAALGYASWPDMAPYAEAAAQQRHLPAPDPELSELVRMATLAPNGHNTQPWVFHLDGDTISIRPDLSRRTAVVDPDDHHLFTSLGCAAETLAIAARAHGHAPEFTRTDDRIDITLGTGRPEPGPLYAAIPARQSTRAPYDGQPLTSDALRQLAAAAGQEGISVEFFTDDRRKEALLDLVVAANSTQMEDPAFIAELRDWLRFTPEEALGRRDGLFTASSGNPVLPGWLTRSLFGVLFTKEAENDKYRSHVRSSAGIAVFTGDAADPEHWIAVGRAYQRFALQATALDIRTAHLNQPVEVPRIRDELAAWMGIPGRRPDLVVRFGHGPTLPMSLRRPPEAVIRPA
ncbi:Acg family FMN-binding oxidoreductase [Allosediminivita pacifica]|uniref:Nitroreductase family protein n=1 Tax=Allosediminivita pacifica TaxID=1267769 RepID=A0A2T6B3X8_9RHOB|nr:nitroreductase family protein [Allosediminivita pacifica]PTX50764.1 nitroreductase family protein [Allosediminivita pacifica]GGB00966.1 Tat pathway signal protein [Allosediminivita pacifica]